MSNASLSSRSLDIALQEIEERTRIEKKLRDTQNYLKIILNAIRDAVIVINEQGLILSFNQNVEKMFGYSFEEVHGKNISILMPEQVAPRHGNYLQSFLETGTKKMMVRSQELKARHKNGSEIEIELSVHQENLDGKRIFIGLVRDISDQKNVKSELENNKERFDLAVKGSLDGLWDWNIQTDEVYFSSRFKEMLGFEEDEISHEFEEWRSRLHPEDINETIDAFQSHLILGLPYEQIYRMKTKSGEYRWFRARGQAVWNEEGRATRMAGGLSDITDLIEARRGAEESTRLKADFLANMSHEIRTPLNGITGMTALLLDTALDAKQKHFAEMIAHSADSLLMLVNDILDFSKIEAGKLSIEYITVDLQNLLEDVIEFMSPKAHEKNIELLLGCLLPEKKFVLSDPVRLRQILYNLITNALKFTKSGSVTLKVEAHNVQETKVDFLFCVEDTGIGIEPDKQHLIFNKFDQADSSTTRKFGGTGLGLAICKHLVELMGGEIGVHSIVGKGSTFWFRLPMEAEAHENGQEVFSEALDPLCRKILLVDDNLHVIEILKGYFEAQGSAEISSAKSADEALHILFEAAQSGSPYDMAIIDHIMPGRSGEELGRIIRAYEELDQTLLVFCTAQPRNEDIIRLGQYKFDGYLTKPILPSTLTPFLNTVFRAKHKGAERRIVTGYDVIRKSSFSQTKFRQNVFFKDANLLLAEDNYVNRQVAAELFRKYGFNVTEVNDGVEAVMAYKNSRFDIIFMDWHMPEMDGVQATKMIRSYEAEKELQPVPVIAFTASLLKGDIETCMQSGMDDYTPKPLDFEDLEKKLLLWTPLESAIFVENRDPVRFSGTLQADDQQDERAETRQSNEQDHPDLIDVAAIAVMKSILGENFSSAVYHYLEHASKYMTTIDEALHLNDFETIVKAAHPLKSSSAQIGARELSELAKSMEKLAGEPGDETVLPRFLSSLYDEMRQSFARTELYFRDYLDADGESSGIPEKACV